MEIQNVIRNISIKFLDKALHHVIFPIACSGAHIQQLRYCMRGWGYILSTAGHKQLFTILGTIQIYKLTKMHSLVCERNQKPEKTHVCTVRFCKFHKERSGGDQLQSLFYLCKNLDYFKTQKLLKLCIILFCFFLIFQSKQRSLLMIT